MSSNTFEGYPKPTLSIQKGALVPQNVPVPQSGAVARLSQRLLALPLRDLQSVVLLQRTLFRRSAQTAAGNNPTTLKMAARIFDDLAELNRKKNSVLVVTFLPTLGEYWLGLPKHIAGLKADVIRKGIVWIDLVDDFRKLSPSEAQRLFIGKEAIPQYKGAAGHYTEEGNDYVARLLYQRITALPAVAVKLEQLRCRR